MSGRDLRARQKTCDPEFSRKFQNVLESSTMFLIILECLKTRYRMLQNVFQEGLECFRTRNRRCYIIEISLTLNSTQAKPGNVARNPINVIVYFATCTENSISTNVRQNRRFSLVANDTRVRLGNAATLERRLLGLLGGVSQESDKVI